MFRCLRLVSLHRETKRCQIIVNIYVFARQEIHLQILPFPIGTLPPCVCRQFPDKPSHFRFERSYSVYGALFFFFSTEHNAILIISFIDRIALIHPFIFYTFPYFFSY